MDKCQSCGNGILHDRVLPHLCECGADLRIQVTVQATEPEIEFSNLLMGHKPENAKLPFQLEHGIPAELDLFVWGMANHFCNPESQQKVGKTPLPKSVDQALAKLLPLFEILDCWPIKFDARLEQMLKAIPKGISTGASARAGRWYFFLFRKYHHLEAFRPLRIATANAIVKSHDGLLNARTSSVINIATIRKNWYSVKEASVELRVSADRINDGIDRCLINAQVNDEAVGYRQRFIDYGEIERLRQLQFEHIDDREARALLQVPMSVYILMCDSEWIIRADKNDIAPVVSGYIKHKPLLALIERLRTSALKKLRQKDESEVLLRNLNLRRTTDYQRLIGLFRAIAAGEISPISHDDTFSVGNLAFSQKDVDKRIASWFVARGLTLEQVSDLTGAHYDAVKDWIRMGLLTASKEPLEHGAPWVIDLRDLTSFLLSYSPLAWQARKCESTAQAMAHRLQRLGIQSIRPPSGRGTLLKLEDLWTALNGASDLLPSTR